MHCNYSAIGHSLRLEEFVVKISENAHTLNECKVYIEQELKGMSPHEAAQKPKMN